VSGVRAGQAHPRVVRFTRKPDPDRHDVQFAARYLPGGDLGPLLAVAAMGDTEAEVREVNFTATAVLLVRYQRHHDEHPPTMEHLAVTAGDWLAWSRDEDFLYDATDANWRQWYERAS